MINESFVLFMNEINGGVISFIVGVVVSGILSLISYFLYKHNHQVFSKYPIELEDYNCKLLISDDGTVHVSKSFKILSNRQGISEWIFSEFYPSEQKLKLINAQKNGEYILTDVRDNKEVRFVSQKPLNLREQANVNIKLSFELKLKDDNLLEFFISDPIHRANYLIGFESNESIKYFNISTTKGSVADEVKGLERVTWNNEPVYKIHLDEIYPGTKIALRWGRTV